MPITTYLNTTVTRKPKSTLDKYGAVTTGTAVNIRARIQEKVTRLFDERGIEFLADAELWVKPTETINLEDLITFESNNYKVVRIDTKRGLTGNKDHKKIYLRRTKE